jgi:hypothetical protein
MTFFESIPLTLKKAQPKCSPNYSTIFNDIKIKVDGRMTRLPRWRSLSEWNPGGGIPAGKK